MLKTGEKQRELDIRQRLDPPSGWSAGNPGSAPLTTFNISRCFLSRAPPSPRISTSSGRPIDLGAGEVERFFSNLLVQSAG